jgi:hypothetical protein
MRRQHNQFGLRAKTSCPPWSGICSSLPHWACASSRRLPLPMLRSGRIPVASLSAAVSLARRLSSASRKKRWMNLFAMRNAHAEARLRLRAGQQGARQPAAAGVPRPSQHPANGTIHRAYAHAVYGLLAKLSVTAGYKPKNRSIISK